MKSKTKQRQIIKRRSSGTYPIHRVLIEMNHAFDNAVDCLGDAGKLKLLRLDYVAGAQVTLESVRANANYNALASAEDRERHNAFRYDRQRERWEDSRKDPNDILLEAEEYRAAGKRAQQKKAQKKRVRVRRRAK